MVRYALWGVVLMWALPAGAQAHATELTTIDEVHEACRAARDDRAPRLYAMTVEPGWRFEPARGDGIVAVDTRRNLSALDGKISLLPARLEPVIALEDDAGDRERALRAASEEAQLTLGFFLGLDEPDRMPCVVRNAHAVTIVRFDLAYVEVRSPDGPVLRHETERYRAWDEDRARLAIPGEGPRGAVQTPRFSNGAPVPTRWVEALDSPELREGLSRCHAGGLARHANPEGHVVVRLTIDTRSGRIHEAEAAVSSIGDEEEADCVARAVRSGVRLPPGPGSWQALAVNLDVTVRLTAQ